MNKLDNAVIDINKDEEQSVTMPIGSKIIHLSSHGGHIRIHYEYRDYRHNPDAPIGEKTIKVRVFEDGDEFPVGSKHMGSVEMSETVFHVYKREI